MLEFARPSDGTENGGHTRVVEGTLEIGRERQGWILYKTTDRACIHRGDVLGAYSDPRPSRPIVSTPKNQRENILTSVKMSCALHCPSQYGSMKGSSCAVFREEEGKCEPICRDQRSGAGMLG